MPLLWVTAGLALLLVFGAMFGKLLDERGAALVIVLRPAAAFGTRMFKRYFNVTVRQTFATWGVMEAIVALRGLGTALLRQALS